MQKKHIKMLIFNILLILIDVICLSNGFLALLSDKSNVFKFTIGITVIIMSVILFFYVNYNLMSINEVSHDFNINNLEKSEDYIEALNSMRHKKIFEKFIDEAIEQIGRLERKNKSFNEVFFQKFQEESDGTDYGFQGIIEDTNVLLFKNIKKLINTIMIFDYKEYQILSQKSYRGDNVSKEKLDFMEESIDYVRDTLHKNEEILLNEDKLLIEMSKIGDTEESDETNLQRINDIVSSMKELRQTKR